MKPWMPCAKPNESGTGRRARSGLVVVALLIGAFWYGSRRSARGRAPARPTEQNPVAQRREDSWQTPDDDAGDQGPRVCMGVSKS